MPLVSGTRLGPYELTGLLGSGGMGDVYGARDTRLGRDVALKLLPMDGRARPEARQRLEREAKAVAALQHPNICTLFDIGETPDGQAYLVMERLHGETVRERTTRGPLPIDELIDTAASLADALEAAHAAGIVHRDLKPANIMLTPRGPKILDFGIAKTPLTGSEAVTTTGFATEPGSRVGTLAYMSPEQLRGEAVDARSDVFSLGLVLYEMTTGRRAFAGETDAVVAAAVLHQPPAPLRTATELPAALEAVVLKALEKDRALRYQHAAELRSDLLRIKRDRSATADVVRPAPRSGGLASRWISALAIVGVAAAAFAAFIYSRPAAAAKLSDTDTIVLADFNNSTGDAVFDDTLRQALSAQLQQSPFLSLVPEARVRRTLRLMDQAADARLTPEVAQELCERTGGAAVLDGSIAPLGSQLVIGLRARHCGTGEILDEQQTQVARKEDVLSALSGMATAFRTRVGESLASVQQYSKPLEEGTTPSLDALKAYTDASRLNRSAGSGAGAVPSYRRALELDPQFALAHAELGLVYDTLGKSGLAREHTARAYELRQRASERERFQISVLYERQVTGNLENARQLLEQWVQAYPRDSMAHGLFAGFTTRGTGRYERTIEEAEKIIAGDPDNGYAYGNIASANILLDRFDEAERALARADARKLQIADYSTWRFALGFLKGDEAAMEAAARSGETSAAAAEIAHLRSLARALRGQLGDARTLSRQAVDLERRDDLLEAAATFAASEAIGQALWGHADDAISRADFALSLARSREVDFAAALALALAGRTKRLPPMIAEMASRFPQDTSVQSNYLPTLRAFVSLAAGEPAKALEALAANTPYQHARPALAFYNHFGGRYPLYLRGMALLAEGKPREAASAFQELLGRRGLLLADPLGALARVQLGRAYAKAGELASARAAYESFFALAKDADAGLPLVEAAKREFALLK